MGGTPEDLRAMDLKIKDTNDECLGYGGWARKRAIHTLAQNNTYQADRPADDGDWWRYTAPTAANSCQAPRCNLPVAVARICANIPAGGAYNADRRINEEAFTIREEMAVWNKKQMLFTKAAENNYKHLDVAAPMNAYPVGNYVGYIPIPAADTNRYVDQFIAHHIGSNPGLEKQHVSVALSVFH